MTHYKTLGIDNKCSDNEIKQAYRALSFKYHPDRNKEADASEKMQQINEAYETLSDKQRRKQYDMELQFGSSGGGFPGGNPGFGNDMNDIFSMMFGGGGFPGGGFPGGGGGPGIRVFHSSGGFPGGGGFPGMGPDIQQIFQQMNKPQPIMKNVQITLEQSFNGDSIEIQIEKQAINNGIPISEIESLIITIPKGIDDGEVIILRDQGHMGHHGQRGDIKIIFKVSNDTIFKRQGLDLIYQKKITLKESLCGFSFEIKHLNGKMLSMNNTTNNSIIKPYYKKVVNNMGICKENQTGNLIIEFLVDFPDSLTREQIDVLSSIL